MTTKTGKRTKILRPDLQILLKQHFGNHTWLLVYHLLILLAFQNASSSSSPSSCIVFLFWFFSWFRINFAKSNRTTYRLFWSQNLASRVSVLRLLRWSPRKSCSRNEILETGEANHLLKNSRDRSEKQRAATWIGVRPLQSLRIRNSGNCRNHARMITLSKAAA